MNDDKIKFVNFHDVTTSILSYTEYQRKQQPFQRTEEAKRDLRRRKSYNFRLVNRYVCRHSKIRIKEIRFPLHRRFSILFKRKI